MFVEKFRGKIIHVTSNSNFENIKKNGFLLPNAEDCEKNFKGMTVEAMGRQQNWVSVFDFRGEMDEVSVNVVHSVLKDIGKKDSSLIVLELDPELISDFHIPPSAVQFFVEKECSDLKYGGKLPTLEVFQRVGKFCPNLEGFLTRATPLGHVCAIFEYHKQPNEKLQRIS